MSTTLHPIDLTSHNDAQDEVCEDQEDPEETFWCKWQRQPSDDFEIQEMENDWKVVQELKKAAKASKASKAENARKN